MIYLDRLKRRPHINNENYCQPECPHCRSHKVSHIKVAKDWGSQKEAMVYCGNCTRVFIFDEVVRRTDRKAVKRHIAQLQRLLEEK